MLCPLKACHPYLQSALRLRCLRRVFGALLYCIPQARDHILKLSYTVLDHFKLGVPVEHSHSIWLPHQLTDCARFVTDAAEGTKQALVAPWRTLISGAGVAS